MSDHESCGYCNRTISATFYLRAVGFTEWLGVTAPLVKTWCGCAAVDDDIDPAAAAALREVAEDVKRAMPNGAEFDVVEVDE